MAVAGTTRPKFLERGGNVLDPGANLRVLDGALRRGEVTAAFAAAMRRTEQALGAISNALAVTQPAGAEGKFAVRWWQVARHGEPLRTPVLVRDKRFGKLARPVRVRRSDAKPRTDRSFELNADLVPGLIEAYWGEYRVWHDLVGLWTEFRRLNRTVARLDGLVSRDAQARAEAAGAVATQRLRGAGYAVRAA